MASKTGWECCRFTCRTNLFPDSDDSSEDSGGGGKALAVNTGGDDEDVEHDEVMGTVDDFDTIIVFPEDD